jgi:hypothetical protein
MLREKARTDAAQIALKVFILSPMSGMINTQLHVDGL